jgi:hypothetical protein
MGLVQWMRGDSKLHKYIDEIQLLASSTFYICYFRLKLCFGD